MTLLLPSPLLESRLKSIDIPLPEYFETNKLAVARLSIARDGKVDTTRNLWLTCENADDIAQTSRLYSKKGQALDWFQPLYEDIIIARDTGDYEDVVEGGYTSIFEIVYCDVNPKKGILEYGRRAFYGGPLDCTGDENAPKAPSTTFMHVSTMTRLNDEEIDELTTVHGIKFEYF